VLIRKGTKEEKQRIAHSKPRRGRNLDDKGKNVLKKRKEGSHQKKKSYTKQKETNQHLKEKGVGSI